MSSEPTTTHPAWPDYTIATTTDWRITPEPPGVDHTKVAVMGQTTINGHRIAATVLVDLLEDPTQRIEAALAEKAEDEC